MTYKFNEFQERWLQDLETTKAQQARGVLTSGWGFCCLGRAYVANGIKSKNRRYEGCDITLGPDMVKTLNLRNRDGTISEQYQPKNKNGTNMSCLTALNDSLKWSFKKIAAFIRKHPEAVFKS